MKLHTNGIPSSILLFALTSSAFASHTQLIQSTDATRPHNVYVGIFGGGGSTSEYNVSQLGTALFTEATGGPLAVNAFGDTGSHSASFLGAQLGIKAQEILLSSDYQWSLVPAVELEGFSMGNKSLNADLVNITSPVTRLPEHEFLVSYSLKRTVYLANIVLNFNKPCLLVQPYIGFGIGSAIVRVSGADSEQLSPPELDVNHFNSNTNDTDTAFAGQVKLGLSYDFNKCVSVFAEYRWLYLANTKFALGSTYYPTHAQTTSWIMKLDAQRSNMGDIGIRFNL